VLDHVSITVPDFAAAERFYDATMAALGVPKVGADAAWLGYGARCDADHPERAYLSIRLGAAPDAAPGRHWCFKAPDRAAVDAFWRAGLAAGGTDDGPPGLRAHYHPHYYAAFLRDPAGNRIEAVCHRAAPPGT
jgi:catechol 2,3-dioxygenase-like lactoylglutathione lyase family enzyme